MFRPRPAGDRLPGPRPGYMEVGRVSETSSDAVAVGDLVAMAYGHKTAHTVDPAVDRFVPLPPDLDPVLGIYVAQMGPICANGLLHAAADVAGPGRAAARRRGQGPHVLVTGAGVVGLLVALFARHHGAAEVAVADATPARLARRQGARPRRGRRTPTAPPGGRSRSAGAATPPTAGPTSSSSAGAGRPPWPVPCAASGPRASSSTSPSTRAGRPTWPSARSSTTTA